jgi:hypothetical protein
MANTMQTPVLLHLYLLANRFECKLSKLLGSKFVPTGAGSSWH